MAQALGGRVLVLGVQGEVALGISLRGSGQAQGISHQAAHLLVAMVKLCLAILVDLLMLQIHRSISCREALKTFITMVNGLTGPSSV